MVQITIACATIILKDTWLFKFNIDLTLKFAGGADSLIIVFLVIALFIGFFELFNGSL